eukprot:gnl/TRDRNA2_/TRDRNA2_200876_c0_seq1.p1 gnl/TRDRNA2_/TRDRNA2_200876_c0~~gnl/TRDRNA2_/TRDRNA2_200876_c0_seq1.p1  ORF type:complete len:201 (+),score=15.93 gnl/TRDRNA2_/TRDRNA2_200876_c0_seq1:147-749(+)
MTAFSGVDLRLGEAYWEVSGPEPMNRNGCSCRACKSMIKKGDMVMSRDGRKMRFFYHERCFTGGADPRTQDGSQYQDPHCIYHTETAPDVSGLRLGRDVDGRLHGRKVFKEEAPRSLGSGKWSCSSRGWQPALSSAGLSALHDRPRPNSSARFSADNLEAGLSALRARASASSSPASKVSYRNEMVRSASAPSLPRVSGR